MGHKSGLLNAFHKCARPRRALRCAGIQHRTAADGRSIRRIKKELRRTVIRFLRPIVLHNSVPYLDAACRPQRANATRQNQALKPEVDESAASA